MTYSLYYHPEVKKDVASFPQNIKNRIKKAIEQRLLIDPLGCTLPLRKSLQGYRKLRVGDYRVIVKIRGQMIIVLVIGHRRDVYTQVEKRR